MSAPELDPEWLAALRASADQPPWRPRLPLFWGAHRMGSVEPDYFNPTVLRHLLLAPELLQQEQDSAGPCWRLRGDATQALARLAQVLLEARVGRVRQQWRDEQLAVCDASGRQIATVERGVVRPLGIATRAVHLVGQTAEGRFWVQQRALDKADDPGLWDTLMGGMVSAADSVQTALARETWEEAGLHLETVDDLRSGGSVRLRKPSSDRSDAGYVVEQVDWFACTVPNSVEPVNQDGEVLQFALLDQPELIEKLQRNEFTTEAALILVAALGCP
ncbi:MAG: NUDIX domain-containing protein [Rhodoferax sp.]|nr:NUDIX domain-containing protein [Rhodoferax sp.]